MDNFIDITINGTAGNGGLVVWETEVPFLYLDSFRNSAGVPAPLVTVGIGCAVGPAANQTPSAEVLGLPWTIGGVAASPEQIASDYAKVCAAPFGYVAVWYAHLTSIRLSRDAMMTLCESRLAQFVAALRQTFPQFDNWPDTAKAGALDLIYGVGIHGFEVGYPHFIAAGRSGNFNEMAAQCASDANNPAYAARNAARKKLFLDAA